MVSCRKPVRVRVRSMESSVVLSFHHPQACRVPLHPALVLVLVQCAGGISGLRKGAASKMSRSRAHVAPGLELPWPGETKKKDSSEQSPSRMAPYPCRSRHRPSSTGSIRPELSSTAARQSTTAYSCLYSVLPAALGPFCQGFSTPVSLPQFTRMEMINGCTEYGVLRAP